MGLRPLHFWLERVRVARFVEAYCCVVALIVACAPSLHAQVHDESGDWHSLPPASEPSDGGFTTSDDGNVPLSQVPQLTSRSSASQKLYLNFVGSDLFNWGTFSPHITPAYSTDLDTTTFSPSEISNIQEVWARVTEKFSPFNIDVTTINPGESHFVPQDSLNVVIGGNGSWYPLVAGGVAGVGSYYNGDSSTHNTVFVFPKNLGNGFPKYVGEASAHEAGHAFGLQHQSTYNGPTKTAEYNPGTYPGIGPGLGTGYKSPVMGLSYYSDRGIWWDGSSSQQQSNGSPIPQSDLPILASNLNAFGYRADDHGSTPASADPMFFSGGAVSASGVIETTDDKDYYSFRTGGGQVNLNIKAARWGSTVIGMLDTKAELFTAQGALVATYSNVAAPGSTSLDELISITLDPGDYLLAVESQGNYGDIGQYTIDGFIPPLAVPEPATVVLMAVGSMGLFAFRRRRDRPRICGARAQ